MLNRIYTFGNNRLETTKCSVIKTTEVANPIFRKLITAAPWALSDVFDKEITDALEKIKQSPKYITIIGKNIDTTGFKFIYIRIYKRMLPKLIIATPMFIINIKEYRLINCALVSEPNTNPIDGNKLANP